MEDERDSKVQTAKYISYSCTATTFPWSNKVHWHVQGNEIIHSEDTELALIRLVLSYIASSGRLSHAFPVRLHRLMLCERGLLSFLGLHL